MTLEREQYMEEKKKPKSYAYWNRRRIKKKTQLYRKTILEEKVKTLGEGSLTEEERGRLTELRELYD